MRMSIKAKSGAHGFEPCAPDFALIDMRIHVFLMLSW